MGIADTDTDVPPYSVSRHLPNNPFCAVTLYFCSTLLLQVLNWTLEPFQGYFHLFLWVDESWCLLLAVLLTSLLNALCNVSYLPI